MRFTQIPQLDDAVRVSARCQGSSGMMNAPISGTARSKQAIALLKEDDRGDGARSASRGLCEVRPPLTQENRERAHPADALAFARLDMGISDMIRLRPIPCPRFSIVLTPINEARCTSLVLPRVPDADRAVSRSGSENAGVDGVVGDLLDRRKMTDEPTDSLLTFDVGESYGLIARCRGL